LCGGVGRKVRLRCAKPARQRLPPLLSYRVSVMMSRAASEPLEDEHELVKRPACAYREVGDHGSLAEAKMDVGGGRRRKTCPGCQNKGRQGYVRHVSYSWSMLSMWTSASLCCLGLVKVFCIVVGEECCGGSCCLKLKREGRHNTNSAAKPATAASADSLAGGKATGRCRNTLEALRYSRR
jgi:hypothetical protein